MGKLSKLSNIIKREDFVNESELKERYDSIEPLKKYSELVDLKPLSEKERVKKFDDYIKEPEPISTK